MKCSLWNYWELESLPSSTIALIEDSVWMTVFLRDLHPLMHRNELLKSAKLTFVLINPTTSAYGSEVLSLSLTAGLVMLFDADGAAPPVVATMSGLIELFSIFMIRCSYFRFIEASWCLNASWICFGQVLAKGLKILTSKKVRQNLESKSPFALMSNLASSSLLVDLYLKVSPSNGWSLGSISTSLQTSPRNLANVSRISLCRRWVYPLFAQCSACGITNGLPHAHEIVILFGSYPYRRAKLSLNSDSVRAEPSFCRGSALNQLDAPFSEDSFMAYNSPSVKTSSSFSTFGFFL